MKTKPTKKKTKKGNRLFLLLGLIFFLSCSSGEHLNLRIELPRKTPIPLDDFDEFIVTNFVIKGKSQDFDINKELSDFFSAELDRGLEKKISSEEISFENEEVFQDQEFWQTLFPDRRGTLLFTGSLEYTQETRKAIRTLQKRQFETPFPEESRIDARKFYSLDIQIYIIDAQTGRSLYKRNFKESKTYNNPNQTSHFAFIDILQSVRDKLFRQLLGEEQVQQRYLIK
jgi:hypothetical protein